MDCNQEQFDSMREELIELGCAFPNDITVFGVFPILVNNIDGISKNIDNISKSMRNDFNRTYIGAFDKEAFLQACGKVEERKSGWYITTIRNKWIMYIDYGMDAKFGFNQSGEWMRFAGCIFGNAIKATNEQVLQRLTEEAEKRGYKGLFELSETMLLCDGVCVMTNGIWADIVPNEIEVIASELAELKKEKTTLLKSRNRYKQLYKQEKKRAVFMEDKIKKDIIYYSELSEDKRLYNVVLAQNKRYATMMWIILAAYVAALIYTL